MTGRKKNQIFGKYGIVPPVAVAVVYFWEESLVEVCDLVLQLMVLLSILFVCVKWLELHNLLSCIYCSFAGSFAEKSRQGSVGKDELRVSTE